ncbi:MAG: ATP-binding protein [Bacilli bacterium]|nr:ATP-binding protein [Bacilli bacterium]
MKTLIVMSALPGAGKSTWAKKYADMHKNTFILSSDEVRFEITHSYQDFTKQKKVWRIFYRRMKKLAKAPDITLIVDALNDTNQIRLDYIKNFQMFDKYILVFMNKEKTELAYFNKQRPRQHWVPDADLRKLYEKFENISDEVRKAYHEVIEINDYA